MRELVVWIMTPSDPLYVFGPTGAGKSSLIRQVAAKLNYPVFDITGHGRLEFNDLAGHLTVENGSMRFQYGPLALAMKFGGLFLLNELDLLDPATAAGLNGVLDGAPLCLPENGGEVIPPHPMFRFVATANTNGASDESGLYQGTLRQNLAFMDRFWLCEVGYRPKPSCWSVWRRPCRHPCVKPWWTTPIRCVVCSSARVTTSSRAKPSRSPSPPAL